jgi:iron complex outermembrane receptor protein
LTISGTFPLFQYKQAEVLFKGIDGFIRYQFLPQWAVNSKASVVRTWNITINDFLIFTPADRYHLGLEYKCISPKKWAISINPELVKVLFQNRTPANTDFAAAPNGYILLNTSIQLQVPFRNSAMYFTLSGYNLLNEAYREYLNRMRYYSLDMGRNVMLQVKIPF